MTSQLPLLSPVDQRANRYVVCRALQLTEEITHCYNLLMFNDKYIDYSALSAVYFPSKYISIAPHHAVPLLDIPVSKISAPVPPLYHQPFIHLVDDSLFIGRPLDHRYSSMASSRDSANTSDNSGILELAFVTRTSADQFLFETAQLDLCGHKVPRSIIQLVLRGHLSLHYTCSEQTSVYFVLHQISNISPSLRNALGNFLSWARNYVGTDALYPAPSFDREWVYDVIRRRLSDTDNSEWHQYMSRVDEETSLNVTLRPYQRRAVAWMLFRELAPAVPLFGKDTEWSSERCSALVSALEASCSGRPSMTIVSTFSFHSASARMWFGEIEQKERLALRIGPGGLLCDQMGLGKTVELLQLVHSNKADSKVCNSHPFFSRLAENLKDGHMLCAICDRRGGQFISASCIECKRPIHCARACSNQISKSRSTIMCQICSKQLGLWSQESSIINDLPQSRATLIIVPTTLLLQWKNEISKHVKASVTVVLYEGLKKSGYIRLHTLINADVVLSTYDALRADVKTAESLRRPRWNMRYARQYFPTPIPLLTTEWHRLALDESQMLGTSFNTAALTMAGLLNAKHRWCVTGTPVSAALARSIAMFSILRQSDGEDIDWSHLCRPTTYVSGRQWVASTIRKVMWRTVMSDVEQTELDLPPQITEMLRINFGPVERYHYQSLQGDIATRIASLTRRHTDRANALSRSLLIALRQACCHPLIGSSGRSLLRAASRQARRGEPDSDARKSNECLDMKTVLNMTISKTQIEFQEALRSFIATLNGMAGLALICHEIGKSPAMRAEALQSAVNHYREALRVATEAKKFAEIDSIQKIHVLFNMNEAFSLVVVEKSLLSANEEGHSDALKVLSELGRTPREGSIKEEFGSLRLKYLSDARLNLQSSTAEHQKLSASLGQQPLIDFDSDNDGDDLDLIKNETGSLCEDVDEDVEVLEGKAQNVRFCERPSEKSFAGKRSDSVSNVGSSIKSPGDASDNVLGSFPSTNSLAHSEMKNAINNKSTNLNKLDESQVSGKRSRRHTPLKWWELAMANVIEDGQEDIFLARLDDLLSANSQRRGITSVIGKVTNFMSLASLIQTELVELQSARIRLNEALKELPGAREPTSDEIAESGACSICRESAAGPACVHCRSEYLISNVERKLYAMSDSSDLTDLLFDNPESNSKASRAQILIHNSWQTSKRVTRTLGLRLQSDLEVLLLMLGGSQRGKPQNMSDARRSTEQTRNQMFKEWLIKYDKVKLELTKAKQVFEAQRALLASMDEVKMAQTRLSLMDSSETRSLSEIEMRCRVARSEIPMIEQRFKAEYIKTRTDLGNCRGRLSYLRHLRSDMEGFSGRKRKNMDDHCTVCFASFAETGQIGVLQCGHFYCNQCVTALMNPKDSFSRVKVECPTCRYSSNRSEVVFATIGPQPPVKRQRHGLLVDNRSQSNDGNSEEKERELAAVSYANNVNTVDTNEEISRVEVDEITPSRDDENRTQNLDVSSRSGRHRRQELASTFIDKNAIVYGTVGCKASAVVRLLRGIWQRNASSKIIIFSEWVEVLDMLFRALQSNVINVWNGSNVTDSKKFGKLTSEFRQSREGLALLLPLKRAGAGLNLIEAQHVVLVEPSMDIALERQAVSRVHRIGQKNVTFVHRIIVEETIEDDILALGDKFRNEPSLNATIEPEDIIEKFCDVGQATVSGGEESDSGGD